MSQLPSPGPRIPRQARKLGRTGDRVPPDATSARELAGDPPPHRDERWTVDMRGGSYGRHSRDIRLP